MLLKLNRLKMDIATEGNTNGGSTTQSTPAAPPQTPPTQAAGSTAFDQYGYAVPAAASTPAAQPPQTPPATDDKNKNEPEVKVPGYDDVPDKPVESAPAPTEEKKPAENTPPPELGYKIEVKDLHEDEIKLVEDLAKKHGFTKEQATAIAEMRKLDIDAMTKVESDKIAAQKAKTAELRSSWKNELQNDSQFGGANFMTSMKQAGTVLEKFFPNTKKMLDEKKGMLPPSTMKDLQALHKTLFSTEPLVEGDKVVDQTPKNPWDIMYGSKT